MKRLAIFIAVLASVRTMMAATLFQQPSVWSGNGTAFGYGWTSQADQSFAGWRTYDNFSLPVGGVINQATWRGIYVDETLHSAPFNATSWNIQILANSAGIPGSVLSSSTIPTSLMSQQVLGTGIYGADTYTIYEFTARLPSFTATAGTTYWFSPISQATNFEPQFSWIQGTGANNACYQTEFENMSIVGTYTRPSDRAFGLSNVAVLPGDYDHSGAVNAADYAVWRQNFGLSVNLPNETATIGVVDQADYVVWRAHAGPGAGTELAANVPEPSSLLLAVLALLLGLVL